MCKEGGDIVLRKPGGKQVHQILRASVAVQTYETKDERIIYMLLQLFRKIQCSVGYLSGGRHLQCVVRPSRGRLSLSDDINLPSTLEILFFFDWISYVTSFLQEMKDRVLRTIGAQTER